MSQMMSNIASIGTPIMQFLGLFDQQRLQKEAEEKNLANLAKQLGMTDWLKQQALAGGSAEEWSKVPQSIKDAALKGGYPVVKGPGGQYGIWYGDPSKVPSKLQTVSEPSGGMFGGKGVQDWVSDILGQYKGLAETDKQAFAKLAEQYLGDYAQYADQSKQAYGQMTGQILEPWQQYLGKSEQQIADLIGTAQRGYGDLGAKTREGYGELADLLRGGYGDLAGDVGMGYGALSGQVSDRFRGLGEQIGTGYDTLASELSGLYGSTRQRALDYLEGAGGQQRKDIGQAYTELSEQQQADLIQRGLIGTGVSQSYRAGTERQEQDALGRLEESLRQQRLAADLGISQQELAAIERLRGQGLASRGQYGAAAAGAEQAIGMTGLGAQQNIGLTGLGAEQGVGLAGLAAALGVDQATLQALLAAKQYGIESGRLNQTNYLNLLTQLEGKGFDIEQANALNLLNNALGLGQSGLNRDLGNITNYLNAQTSLGQLPYSTARDLANQYISLYGSQQYQPGTSMYTQAGNILSGLIQPEQPEPPEPSFFEQWGPLMIGTAAGALTGGLGAGFVPLGLTAAQGAILGGLAGSAGGAIGTSSLWGDPKAAAPASRPPPTNPYTTIYGYPQQNPYMTGAYSQYPYNAPFNNYTGFGLGGY